MLEKNAREEKVKEIRDAKKIEKARITQIEKDRVGQLTPAQKKTEALVKRNINKEKKQMSYKRQEILLAHQLVL